MLTVVIDGFGRFQKHTENCSRDMALVDGFCLVLYSTFWRFLDVDVSPCSCFLSADPVYCYLSMSAAFLLG